MTGAGTPACASHGQGSVRERALNRDEGPNLSGGNQQKVVIGKVLMPKPRVLLMDEPTKGVDIASKADIYRLMTDLAKSGVAIIFVSSEFPELIAMSHRVVVLARGTVRETLPAGTTEKRLMLGAMGFADEQERLDQAAAQPPSVA